MERKFYRTLLEWKSNEDRMPLVLLGARQVGKTWLLTRFGRNEYKTLHHFNFQENPDLSRVFKKDLDPVRILAELSIIGKKVIRIETDLVLFDEVQDCDQAVTSLKYFQEKMPELHLAAAGSLLGVQLNSASFPVGKVETFDLFPLTFEEFLDASGDTMAIKLYAEINRLESAHNLLWDYLCQYFFVGGMPAAAKKWFADTAVQRKITAVRKVQKDVLRDFQKDFSKHSGKVNALQISTLFEAVPQQIAKVLDGSLKRFRFKDVLPNKRTYAHLANAISWVENAGLVHKTFSIESRPRVPLKAFVRENRFKLYLFDVGLLGCMLELTHTDLTNQDYGIAKGAFAENFVACELRAMGVDTLYSWGERSSEIEFLHVTPDSEIIPVEVKSGRRTKAKSLKGYIDRYTPARTIKLVGKVGGTDDKHLVPPLYFAGKLNEILRRLS